MRDLPDHPYTPPADPVRASQEAMRKHLPKRFYTGVAVHHGDDGRHRVLLDGRAVKTPGRADIALPGHAVAAMLAAEFSAQAETINPATMPVYRLVNTALDGVATDMAAVADDIIRYFGSDLLCYRADGPEGLVERQRNVWDPILGWLEARISARFILAEGVMHVDQPERTIAAAGAMVRAVADPLQLAGLHMMTTLTGSAIIALAVMEGAITPEAAWVAAHVDENWNIERWGEDAEATATRALKWRDMAAAAGVVAAIRGL